MKRFKRFIWLVMKDLIKSAGCLIVIVIVFGILRPICEWVLAPLGTWIQPHLPFWMRNNELYMTNVEMYVGDCMTGALAILIVVAAICWYIADRLSKAG